MGLELPQHDKGGAEAALIQEVSVNIFRKLDQTAWRRLENGGTIAAFPATLSHEGHEHELNRHRDFGGRRVVAVKFQLHLDQASIEEARLPAVQEQRLAELLSVGTRDQDFNCITFVSQLCGVRQTTFKNLSPDDWTFECASPGAQLACGEPFLIARCEKIQQPIPTLSDLAQPHAGIYLAHGLTVSCFGNTAGFPLAQNLVFASVEELMQGYGANVMWRMAPRTSPSP